MADYAYRPGSVGISVDGVPLGALDFKSCEPVALEGVERTLEGVECTLEVEVEVEGLDELERQLRRAGQALQEFSDAVGRLGRSWSTVRHDAHDDAHGIGAGPHEHDILDGGMLGPPRPLA